MDALTIPISVVTEFKDTLTGLDEHRGKIKQIFSEDAVGFVNIFRDKMQDVFGRQASNILNSFLGSMINTGGNFTAAWKGNWDSILSYGTSALQSLANGSSQTLGAIGNGLSGLIKGFQTGGIWGAIGGGVLGLVTTLAAGPTDQQLLGSQGKHGSSIFGSAFDGNAAATMSSVANSLPGAISGKVDAIAAMYHPDTMAAIIDNLDDFGQQTQEKFAHIFEDNVKPVLMTTLGFSESEAAKMMQPLLEKIYEGAKATGESISPTMNRMIGWAQNLGTVLDVDVSRALNNVQQAGETMLGTLDNRLESIATKTQALTNNSTSERVEHSAATQLANQQQTFTPMNFTINTDNPTGFRSYLSSGGAAEIQRTMRDAAKYGYHRAPL